MRPQLSVVCVGKLRETFWRDAAAEYVKRLGGYAAKVSVVEVGDEPTPDGASAATEAAIREREGEKLLAKLGERDYVVVCDAGGRGLDSPALARTLARLCAEESVSSFAFVVGGSLGLSDAVKARANLTLSFGAMTFPHQLLRVMLLEQLYRAFKIDRGEAYHK